MSDELRPSTPIRFTEVFTRKYEVLKTLGYGGMAEVFLATHKELGREVAIKVLSPLAFTAENSLARFEQEGRLTARLEHPNIVTLLDLGTDGDRPYLVFEYVPGRSLRDLIREEGHLPLGRAARLGLDIASGLEVAHAAGVIHRDLKPENVLIAEDGSAKVADFGLAKVLESGEGLTREGIVLGTPGYMAPEVIQGKPATARSDLYAIGIILYELVSGQIPFADKKDRALLVEFITRPVKKLAELRVDVPRAFQEFLSRNLSRDPDRRSPDARSFIEELQESTSVSQLRRTGRARKTSVGPAPSREPPPKWRSEGQDAQRDTIMVQAEKRTTPVAGVAAVDASAQPPPTVIVRTRPSGAPVAAAVGLLALAAVGGFIALLMRGPSAEPGSEHVLVGEVSFVVGYQSVRVDWKTSRPCLTLLRWWKTGGSETDGKILAERLRLGEEPQPRIDHSLVLEFAVRDPIQVRPVLGEGHLARESFEVSPAESPDAVFSDYLVEFTSTRQARVTFRTTVPLTGGLRLKTPTGDETEIWSDRGPDLLQVLTVPEVGPDQVFEVAVLFRELLDAIPRQPILGANQLLDRLVPNFRSAEKQDLLELYQEVVDIFGRPDRGADTDPAAAAAARLRDARSRVARFFEKYLKVELHQTTSMARYLLGDATAPLDRRLALHGALAQLAEIDRIAREYKHPVLFKSREGEGSRLEECLKELIEVGIAPAPAPAPAPHSSGAETALLELEAPATAREGLEASPLVLFNQWLWQMPVDEIRANLGGPAAVDYLDGRRKLVLALQGSSPRAVRIPLPESAIPDAPTSRLALRIANLQPWTRIQLGLGRDRVLMLRPPEDWSPTHARRMSLAEIPQRQDIIQDSSVLEVTLPTGLLRGVPSLELKLESLYGFEQMPDLVWLTHLSIGP